MKEACDFNIQNLKATVKSCFRVLFFRCAKLKLGATIQSELGTNHHMLNVGRMNIVLTAPQMDPLRLSEII